MRVVHITLSHYPIPQQVYTSYARSHLYYAFDLVSLLVLVALVDTPDYAALTWSTWLVVVCILVAPFWFNPQTFQIERCKDDFENWILWMTDVADNETRSTWWVGVVGSGGDGVGGGVLQEGQQLSLFGHVCVGI